MLFFANPNFVCFGIDFYDVQRVCVINAQAFALAICEVMDAVVIGHFFAGRIQTHDPFVQQVLCDVLLDEIVVALVADEADAGRIFFARVHEALALGEFADFRLFSSVQLGTESAE